MIYVRTDRRVSLFPLKAKPLDVYLHSVQHAPVLPTQQKPFTYFLATALVIHFANREKKLKKEQKPAVYSPETSYVSLAGRD